MELSGWDFLRLLLMSFISVFALDPASKGNRKASFLRKSWNQQTLKHKPLWNKSFQMKKIKKNWAK